MPIVNFQEALEQANESIQGLDVLEFTRPVGGGSAPKVEVLKMQVSRRSQPSKCLGYAGIPMAKKGVKSICSYLDVPYSFLQNEDVDFQAYVLNHIAERKELVDTSKAIVQNDCIIHWVARSKVLVSDVVILQIFAEFVESLGLLAMVDTSKSFFGLDGSGFSVYFHDYEHEVVPGDTIYPGFRYSGSVMGSKAPSLEFYIFRLVCSNGLIRKMGNYKESLMLRDMEYPVRVQEFLVENIPRALEEALEFASLRDIPVDDPTKTLYSLSDHLRLGAAKRDDIIYLMDPDNPPETMYDMVNLVTSYANFQSPMMAASLQSAGGRAMDLVRGRSVCSTCHGLVPLKSAPHEHEDEE